VSSPPTSSGAIQTAFLPCQRPAITFSAKKTDAGSQTANAGHRRAHQQDGADHLGATCKAGKLHSSGRSQGVSLADLRSSPVQSVEGGYGATVGETGPEEPDVLIVPGARFYDLVPVRELPYRPAAPSLHQRPDRWQHPTSHSFFCARSSPDSPLGVFREKIRASGFP
jgi:hypothetical protein